ncbi:unnamed protein product [Prunus armeniaca]
MADFLEIHPWKKIENMDSMDIANVDLLSRAHTYLSNPIYLVHLTPWKLYFDGSKPILTSGAGIVLEDSLGMKHCYSFQLDFQCTNNIAEYEVLIIGLEMLIKLGVQFVEILGDSMLVLKQIVGEFKPFFSCLFGVSQKPLGGIQGGYLGTYSKGRKVCNQ